MEGSHVVIDLRKPYTLVSPQVVYALAKEKGWFYRFPFKGDEELMTPETMGDYFIPAQLGMIQSEAIEALIATTHSDLVEELADTLLRSFSLMGFLRIDPRNIQCYRTKFSSCTLDTDITINLVTTAHNALSSYRSFGVRSLEESLMNIVAMAISIAEHFNLNIEEAVAEKHEFNKTREYRHGGKFV